MGKGNRRTGTKPETALRSALHKRGLRFRKDYSIATAAGRVKVDVAFTRARVAVFVDGCFWHCCPLHGTVPKRNVAYWQPKLRRNVERDRCNDEALRAAGWQVVRIWEHQEPDTAAAVVADMVAAAEERRTP